MRRALAGAAVLVALVAFVAAGGEEDDGYRVRAIFDDAPPAVGSDVQIAGVQTDLRPRLLPDPPGQVQMIEVEVGDDDTVHLLDTDAGGGQAGCEGRAPGRTVVPGIDEHPSSSASTPPT